MKIAVIGSNGQLGWELCKRVKSKAQGEIRVRTLLRVTFRLKEHIIIRTAWLYGIHGNNFVKTMLGLGKEKETLRVVADQYGCPTCAADLAEAILTIAEQIKKRHNIPWGTYHYCSKGKTTWHGFAEKIFELAGQYDSFLIKKVIPVTTAEYPTPARRPLNSVMDCSMLTKNFGISPAPWQENLATMLRQNSKLLPGGVYQEGSGFPYCGYLQNNHNKESLTPEFDGVP